MANPPTSLIPDAIQDQTQRYRQLFEEAPVAYHEIDTSGVIREVNQAECLLLRYRPDELIGHHIWEFVAVESQQAARDAIARKTARQEPLNLLTREYRRSDGNYIWLEIHEKLIENADGEVVGIRSALFDITERHNSQMEMRRHHDWMRQVLQSIGTGIVAANALGNVNFLNPAAEMLTGWRQQDALGGALEDICPVWHDHGEPVELMSCILTGPVSSNRLRKFVIVDRSGASHSISWIISPVCNDNGAVTGAVLVIEKR